MSDDSKQNRNAEYQFPEEEAEPVSSSYGASSARSRAAQPPINPELGQQAQRLSLLVFIVIMGFTLFHFFSKKKNEAVDTNASVKTTAAVTSAQKEKNTEPLQADQTHKKVSKMAKDHAAAVTGLKSELSQVRQTLMSDDSRIHHLEISLEHIENAVSDIGDSLADFQLQKQNLMKAITQLQKQIKTVKSAAPKVRRVAKRSVMVPKMTYTLAAVVRGRAWVKGTKGESITVKVGDRLKDYGVVRVIDPIHGIVATTSGRLITYGADDY